MFRYYCFLALRSFRKNKALTALMILAIGLGIGASMTTLTVFHVLSGDPIPHKSDRLFYVQLDAASMQDFSPGEEPESQLTRFDAEALLREARADRQVMMAGGSVAVRPEKAGHSPFYADARYASTDFFAMFDVPFLFGAGWNAQDDQTHARVAVISRELNESLFDGADSVGRSLRLDNADFRVIGVLDRWRPTPKYYDMNVEAYGEVDQVYLPFSTSRDLKMSRNGTMNCWGDSGGDAAGTNAPCSWIQYWVELDPASASEFRDYLSAYSEQQRGSGRFERPANIRLRDTMQWLDFNKVVPGDVRLQVWLAFGFLLVCLINTVGLLLAKCLRRSSEIGVRRALGASRRAIFSQFLVEAGALGIAGGLLGLVLAWLGLWGIRQSPTAYASLARLDWQMLLLALAVALLCSLAAGLLPAWRACQVAPAIQLKSP